MRTQVQQSQAFFLEAGSTIPESLVRDNKHHKRGQQPFFVNESW